MKNRTWTSMRISFSGHRNALWKLWPCAIWLMLGSAVAALPEGPRVKLLEYPATLQTTGKVHWVASDADLQAVIEAAQPGDQIVLEAGKVYMGNFVLPKKSGQGWITLRSSASDRLPGEGVRVRPEHAGAMPKLVSPNAQPALEAAPGAAFYRVAGIEIRHAADVNSNSGLVSLGGTQVRLEDTPHDLIFDQVYVHGHTNAALKRGFALNSSRTVIANSWISDCHVAGQDAQAIGGWNGPGPYKIVNNYLEGSGENVMFGGSDPAVPGLVPEDIEIRGNHLCKPLNWRQGEPGHAGPRWTVKNLFELKNARRVWIEGNVMEYSWVHGQVGFGILLTPRNQGGKAPWCTVEDVTFVNNIVRHCSSGISVLAEDDGHQSSTVRRIRFGNNLLTDINPGRFGGDGRLLQIISPGRAAEDLVFDGNTMLHGGPGNTFICFDGKARVAKNFVFRNNIVTRGQYGIHSSKGMGQAGLEAYCEGFVLAGNLIIGQGGARGMPEGNRYASTLEEVGIRARSGDLTTLDVKPSDDHQTGADLAVLARATSGAISGVWK